METHVLTGKSAPRASPESRPAASRASRGRVTIGDAAVGAANIAGSARGASDRQNAPSRLRFARGVFRAAETLSPALAALAERLWSGPWNPLVAPLPRVAGDRPPPLH